MNSRPFRLALWVVFGFFAGAAFAQETAPDTAEEPDDAETCFDVTRAQDMNVISDQHVCVGTIGGNQYLLTMTHVCRNLQRSYRSEDVRIQPYGRRVCPNDGSHLLYEWSGRESVCPIMTIEAVDDREEAREIAARARSPVEVEAITRPD